MRPSLAAAALRGHLLNPSPVAAAPSTAQTWTLFLPLRVTAQPSLHLFLRVTALRALPYQHLLLLLLLLGQ